MNGISKESYLKANPDLKDEMMFDLVFGLHEKIETHVLNCPLKKSIGRLWAYVIALPSMIGLILLIINFMDKK